LLGHEKYRYHALYFSERRIDAFIFEVVGLAAIRRRHRGRAGSRGGAMQTRMKTDMWPAKRQMRPRKRNSAVEEMDRHIVGIE
jgi:hypothetical protein